MAINVSSNIKNTINRYLTDAEQIKGGYGVVATVDALSTLPTRTIINGSLYYVTAVNAFYQYNGSTWEVKDFGSTYTEGTGIDISNQNVISVDTTTIATQSDLSGKQDTLVSGTTIKTINNTSLLGSGNIAITPGTEMTFSDVPADPSTSYDLRQIVINGETWNIVGSGGSGGGTGSYTAGTGIDSAQLALGVIAVTGSVYKYMGSCTYANLPASPSAGDTWNVTDAHGSYPAGTNYAWNGTSWDALGGAVDLSNYATVSQVNAKSTVVVSPAAHTMTVDGNTYAYNTITVTKLG